MEWNEIEQEHAGFNYHITDIFTNKEEKQSVSLTIFCIHGLGGRSEQFYPLIQNLIPLLQQNQIIAQFLCVDLLGHGKSDKPLDSKKWYSSEEHMTTLEWAVSTFSVGKCFVFLSHSMGTGLSMLLYCKLKSTFSIKGLILFAPSNENPLQQNVGSTMLQLTPVWLLEALRPLASNSFKKSAYHSESDPELVEREAQIGKTNPMHVIKHTSLQMKWPTKQQILQDIAAQNDLFVWIVVGETDGIIALEKSRALLDWIESVRGVDKRCKWLQIPKTSHNLMLEKPEKISKELLELFLNL